MSMRWLRLHLKEIIWATVILFVLSCFIIGYGTSRAARTQEERKRRADAAEKRARERQEAIPENLVGKMNLPAVHVSLPTPTASITRVIDVQTVYNALRQRPEYKRLMGMPPAFRASFGSQIREGVLKGLIMEQLVGMYAQANGIKPSATPQAMVGVVRQKMAPVDFNRRLHEMGLTEKELGDRLYLEEIKKMVEQIMSRPVPAASATDEFLKSFYEQNKIRFKKDDEVSLRHLVISPEDFAGQTAITEEEIKEYFDKHRKDFMSSKRVSVLHMVINPDDPAFRQAIPVEESEIRRRYAEQIETFKEPEQVQARHILIKPRNTFEKDLETFSVSLRRFTLATDTTPARYTFEMAVDKAKAGINLKATDITLVLTDGQRLQPAEGLDIDHPIALPIAGAPKETVRGKVAFLLPAAGDQSGPVLPATLEIRDHSSTHRFDIAAAHDLEKAFAAAEARARELLAQIQEGKEDFASLASQFSEDIASKKDGGNLGFFSRGQMVKPFEEAAFGAAIGEVKGPVRSNFGYHLIKVEGRKAERVIPLEEARPKLIEEIRKEQAHLKAETNLQVAREYLERKSQTFGELARKYSMGSTVTQDGRLPVFFKGEITDDYTPAQKAILSQEIGDNGHIIPEIENEVFKLEPGEVSEVIKTQTFNEKGEPVVRYHLFQVESFLEPIQLSFTESVKSKIRDILEKEARRKLAEAKAKEFATQVTPENFEALASSTFETQVASLTLPFSTNPGYSNFALTPAVGQVTMDGHTWVPGLHKGLLEALRGFSEAGPAAPRKVFGPVESELGFHFFQITEYKSNQVVPFEEIKDKLRRMLVQVPTEEEVQKEFEKNREQFDQPAKRKVRQIVTTTLDKAEEVMRALKRGEMFSLLAKRYSVDGTSSNGGLLGEVARGQLPASLDEELWKLKKGEYTKPIQTSYGYVIMMLDEDEKPAVKATLTPEIARRLREYLKNKNAEELFESFITGLWNSATVIRHSEVLNEL
ncbi:MAG: Survival protein SurA precursor (Peptidyl-prolyl cis-trans isomerase SurA) [Candidatus Ozemobacter sibiricus]|uniref:Survival protein SurA (Peptidyl-prolyl cis-trans isomerase SurA) n=1 Tax=Candidatus Ozemobacter sibiricus TaxID=2268124 RepID=A0A367ZTV2_9BACT|nr:MAG: Survival protein SurA precursor (Peptidyl-prolyl cis-trans isomerase SurA) [Candidatus Ozemobacter sibiricus]